VRRLSRRARERCTRIASRSAGPQPGSELVNPPIASSPLDVFATKQRVLPAGAESIEPSAGAVDRDGLLLLAAGFDAGRRRRAVEDGVAEELGQLDPRVWHVERDVATGAERLSFLLIGSAGIFGLRASDGQWDVGDFGALERTARQATAPLRCEGPIVGVVCLALDLLSPQFWHDALTPGAPGGWLVGVDWLVPWLQSLPSVGALSPWELDLLRREAGPHWNRGVHARMPSTPRLG
jgi:hypothetical protein